MQLQLQKKTNRKAPTVPTGQIKQEAKNNNPLIIVEKNFDDRYIPMGYTKLEIQSPVDKFMALVKTPTVAYINNSAGDTEDGLDALMELYERLMEESDAHGGPGSINIGGIDFLKEVRENYEGYATNLFLQGKGKEEHGSVNNVSFNQSEIEELCLNHDYVDERVRAITAITNGQSLDEIEEQDLAKVLGFEGKHDITQEINLREIADLDPRGHYQRPEKSQHRICTGDSFYYLKPELRDGQDGWDYDLESRTRTRSEFNPSEIKAIDELEKEIVNYQSENGVDVTNHTQNCTRAYANLKYGAGLSVDPAREIKPVKNE